MVVPPAEVDALLQTLRPVTDVARQIGTDDFMKSYCVDLERLALQAHLSAADEARGSLRNDGVNVNRSGGISSGAGGASGGGGGGGGNTAATTAAIGALAELANVGRQMQGSSSSAFGHEYVVEAILLEGKLEVLVRSLLALECWRTQVLFPPEQPLDDDEEEKKKKKGKDEETVDTNGDGRGKDTDAVVLETDESGAFDIDGAAVSASSDASNVDDTKKLSHCQDYHQYQRGLAPLLAQNKNSLRAAFILHAETTIVSLLSLIFYRREAFDDDCLSGEVAVALVDYVARCHTALAVPLSHNPMVSKQRTVVMTSNQVPIPTRTALEEIQHSTLDAQYKTSMAALNLAQYLCQHVEELPLAARSRLLETHDFPLLMIPLIEEPPWTRRREKVMRRHRPDGDVGVDKTAAADTTTTMVWEKYVDGDWSEVEPDELLRLTKCEAQPWLVLYHLLCNSPSCREAYGLNTYRKAQLLRARKYLVAALTDQLPIMADLARYLDELSIMGVPEATEATRGRGGGGLAGGGRGGGSGGMLLMEQVDTLREDVVRTAGRQGWAAVVKEQFDSVFSKVTDAKDESLRLISSEVYDERFESVLVGGGGDDGGTSDGKEVGRDIGASLQRRPISSIVVSVARNAGSDDSFLVDCFQLVPDEGGKSASLVESPDGSGAFLRTKFKVTLLDGSSNVSSLVVPSGATINAKIFYHGIENTSTLLKLKSIDLPTTQADVKSKKEWRQLGSLDDNLVVQLAFKLISSEEGNGASSTPHWTLSQAFVSRPETTCI